MIEHSVFERTNLTGDVVITKTFSVEAEGHQYFDAVAEAEKLSDIHSVAEWDEVQHPQIRLTAVDHMEREYVRRALLVIHEFAEAVSKEVI